MSIPCSSTPPKKPLLMSQVLGTLSYSLDMAEGQSLGHSIRCCWIGMHIGQQLLLSLDQLWELYYSILLKDAGSSSTASHIYNVYGADDRKVKKEFKAIDNHDLVQTVKFVMQHTRLSKHLPDRFSRKFYLATHGEKLAEEFVKQRCDRGAEIAKQLGFNDNVSQSIRFLDEHWNGKGRPLRLSGEQIPVYSQIALLSQVVDIYYQIGGVEAVKTEMRIRKGVWFNPELVDAFNSVSESFQFWGGLKSKTIDEDVQQLEPESRLISVNDERFTNIARVFSQIADAKSHYTIGHSARVEKYSSILGKELGLSEDRLILLKQSALLHDLGKLGISNTILDKPERLTSDEWLQVKNHAKYTEDILQRLSPLSELAFIASSHHERLNGQGYPRGLSAEQIPIESRIITVCDIFSALISDRPYRKAIPLTQALSVLEKQRDTSIDGKCLDVLKRNITDDMQRDDNQKVA